MGMTASTVRMDSNLKKELVKKLNDAGLTFNGYVNMAAKQYLIQGKVPFEIKSAPDTEKVTFNKETRKAIIRAQAEEEGVIPNTAKSFTNTEDLMKDLFADE